MASRKKSKTARPSKAELRARALKGWRTRRAKYTKKQIRQAAKKGPAVKKVYQSEKKRSAANIRLDNVNEAFKKQLVDIQAKHDAERARDRAEHAAEIARIKADALGYKEEVKRIALQEVEELKRVADPIFDMRLNKLKHWGLTEEHYNMLFVAEQDHDFDRVARLVAIAGSMPLREVYSLWMSPK